jgi:hypothetical protein
LEIVVTMSRMPSVFRHVSASASKRVTIERGLDVKYMLMMHMPATDSGGEGIHNWPPDDIKRHIAFMKQVDRDLVTSGELVDAQGLAWPSEARIVRASRDGQPVVTDGPFAESKEFLIGYWIVDCETIERVNQIAAHISAAPGPGGTPLEIPLELRQVMSGPPEDL